MEADRVEQKPFDGGPPAPGEIFSAVGADHTAVSPSIDDGTGPGRVARTATPTGLAVARTRSERRN
jgi:hypothetical protein